MKENLTKTIQKFLNTPFKYTELLAMLDKQKDFLSQKNILDKTDECEYNALWDTINDLENFFAYAKTPNLTIGAEVGVLAIFNYNYAERNKSLELTLNT